MLNPGAYPTQGRLTACPMLLLPGRPIIRKGGAVDSVVALPWNGIEGLVTICEPAP